MAQIQRFVNDVQSIAVTKSTADNIEQPMLVQKSKATRRQFVAGVGAVTGSVVLTSLLPAVGRAKIRPADAESQPLTAPVVSFYMDRPYVDKSGTMKPYVPPLCYNVSNEEVTAAWHYL